MAVSISDEALRQIGGVVLTHDTHAVGMVTYGGQCVADYLNAGNGPGQERIIELLRRIKELLARSDFVGQEVTQAVEEIGKLFDPYIYSYKFHANISGNRLHGYVISASQTPVEEGEIWSAKAITELAQQVVPRTGENLASGIRMCKHCARWLFTRKLLKQFWCNRTCRDEWKRSNPEGIANQRQYRKKHYRLNVSPNAEYYRRGEMPPKERLAGRKLKKKTKAKTKRRRAA